MPGTFLPLLMSDGKAPLLVELFPRHCSRRSFIVVTFLGKKAVSKFPPQAMIAFSFVHIISGNLIVSLYGSLLIKT